MSYKNLLLGLAVTGQMACGDADGQERPDFIENASSPEAVEGAGIVNNLAEQVHQGQRQILEQVENLAEIEENAWQRVIEATPEMVARDRVEELWKNPTPEFLDYMRLWNDHVLGMEPLYRHGLLNREIYERYMNVNADFQDFSRYINSIIDYINTTNEFTAEQKARFLNIRNDQLLLLRNMGEVISASETQNNHKYYNEEINRAMEQIESARPENNDSFFSRSSASDPLLAQALIYTETLPRMPDDVPIELVRLHGVAMLQSGFFANAKLSIYDLPEYEEHLRNAYANGQIGLDTTKHVISGFPHLTYSSARNIFTLILQEQDRWPYSQITILGNPEDPDFVSRNFQRVMTDIYFATSIFIAMVHDNRSRFADFVNNDARAVEFIRDDNNQDAFIALSIMYNITGGNYWSFDFAHNLLVEVEYDQERFIEALIDRANYERWNNTHAQDEKIAVAAGYVRRAFRMYHNLQN